MDDALLKLNTVMKDHASGQPLQDCGAYVATAIDHRQKLYKVYKAIQNLNSVEAKAVKEAEKYQKQVDQENTANVVLIVLIILALIGTVGGVVYCKTQKKACFAEKDEEGAEAEGGQADRTLYKNQVKNNSKTHKESLVADEQA